MTREISDVGRIVDNFGAYLRLERGMSDNTVEAYTDDVGKLLSYLADSGIALRSVDLDTLRLFAGALHDLGIAARSQKRILSGVRSFSIILSWRTISSAIRRCSLRCRRSDASSPKFSV